MAERSLGVTIPFERFSIAVLAICKTIVEAHGGTISLSSTPEKGTQFTVRLPIEARPR